MFNRIDGGFNDAEPLQRVALALHRDHDEGEVCAWCWNRATIVLEALGLKRVGWIRDEYINEGRPRHGEKPVYRLDA